MAQGDGVKQCELAFERLLTGNVNVPAHVGLPRDRITASVVSVEAGFDRGYLKKGRAQHLQLIARIEASKKNVESDGGLRERYRRAKASATTTAQEASRTKFLLDKVLTQNLTLVERVRELEKQLETMKSLPGRHI